MKLENKKQDIEKLQEQEKALYATFASSLGENNKFENFLTRVFKKKIKRAKKKAQTEEGSDEDSEDDESDDDFSSTDEDDSDAEELDDSVCPPGCDQVLSVCHPWCDIHTDTYTCTYIYAIQYNTIQYKTILYNTI